MTTIDPDHIVDDEPAPIPQPDEPEQEQGDERDQDDAEQDEREPQQPDTFVEMREANKRLDRLAKDNTRRIGDILGEIATTLVPCELCAPLKTPGWRMSEGLPQVAIEAVLHAIGETAPSDYAPDPYSQECPGCRGFGGVATGSKVQGQTHLPCIRCGGKGWEQVGPERGGPAPFAANVTTTGPNGNETGYAPQAPPAQPEPPEVSALRAKGYAVIAPGRPS